jgi:hypothetical protein
MSRPARPYRSLALILPEDLRRQRREAVMRRCTRVGPRFFARCVPIHAVAEMSRMFQLLVRKIEDATSSAAKGLRRNAASRRYEPESTSQIRVKPQENTALSFFGKISAIRWLGSRPAKTFD